MRVPKRRWEQEGLVLPGIKVAEEEGRDRDGAGEVYGGGGGGVGARRVGPKMETEAKMDTL